MAKRKMYYALRTESPKTPIDENGDEMADEYEAYGAPIEFRGSISPGKGSAYAQPFGMDLDYSKSVYITGSLPITEGARIWAETEPPDDVNSGDTADYYVAGVAKSMNSTVYALKTVKKNGGKP